MVALNDGELTESRGLDRLALCRQTTECADFAAFGRAAEECHRQSADRFLWRQTGARESCADNRDAVRGCHSLASAVLLRYNSTNDWMHTEASKERLAVVAFPLGPGDPGRSARRFN
jgi:hypothetical protein